MKKVFKSLLVFIFLISNFNICYAKELNSKREYISKNTTVVNHLYDSVMIKNKQYNSSTVYSRRASNLDELKLSIKSAMINREQNINIKFLGLQCYDSNKDVDIEVIQNAIEEMLEQDHYLKYSLRGYSIGVRGYYGDLDINLKVQYLTTKSQEEYVDNKVKQILKDIITEDMNDYLKERVIHDYIVTHVKYDTSLYEHSAYAALKKGTTVCQGYSLLMYKMLKEVGIKNIIVESEPMKHVWNMVYIDNKWYHVDVTWDDPVPDQPNRILYDYYNLTDFEISLPIKGQRHVWDRSKYPRAYTPYISLLERIEIPKEKPKIQTSIINNITFTIKLNENIPMKKIELFDGEKYLNDTTNINGKCGYMTYNGNLEEKFYKLKITVEDGRTCFTNVKIESTLQLLEVDNENRFVKIKSLIDGYLTTSNGMVKPVEKGEVLIIRENPNESHMTISIIPNINEIYKSQNYSYLKVS